MRADRRLLLALACTLVGCQTSRDVLVGPKQDGGDVEPPPRDAAVGDALAISTASMVVRPTRTLGVISPAIYGMEYRNVGASFSASERVGLVRLGDVAASTYNWENNAANLGAGACFANAAPFGGGDAPAGGVVELINVARGFAATALVTIPMLDFVAADKLGGEVPPLCSGDVRKTPGFEDARFRRNVPRKAQAASAEPDVTDRWVYQSEFVERVRALPNRGTVVFGLDRDPQHWYRDFPHLHPTRLTYDELAARNLWFAGAVKAAWPEAFVVASTLDGWAGLTSLDGAADAAEKGWFLPFFLERFRGFERAHNRWFLDAIDVAWQPALPSGDPGDPHVLEARLQSPRSLWDPSYVEASSITASLGGQPVRLIPRLRELVAMHRPGTRLAFTSWNFGASGHPSGALVTADALGIFGREGVRLASYTFVGNEHAFALAAFRLFRNYDGNGGAFGDTAVEATTDDLGASSVYASIDATNPRRLVLVLINKRSYDLPVDLRLEATPVRYVRAVVYRVGPAAPELRQQPDVTAEDGGDRFTFRLPPLSVTVLVPSP